MSRLSFQKEYLLRSSKRLKFTSARIIACAGVFSQSIKKIRDGLSKQKDLIRKSEQIGAEAQPIFASIHQSVQQTQAILQNSQGISRQAQEAMAVSIGGINQAIEAVHRFNAHMAKLRQELGTVETINRTITDIADRTKTIAINSNIIAYKSGVFGRSFSVVAREVENLSAQTANATVSIQGTIARINTNAAHLIEQMAESITRAEQSKAVAMDVSTTVDGIAATITHAAQVATATGELSGQLNHKNGQIIQQIDAINQSGQQMLAYSDTYIADISEQEGATHELEKTAQRSVDFAQECCAALKMWPYRPTRLAFHEEPIKRPDPALALYTYELSFTRLLNVQLTRYTEAGSIVPYLAETWMLDDDQKTWHFKIRENARFINGDEITTEDIRFSLERVMHPALHSPYANTLAVILEGAEAFIDGSVPHISGIEIDGRYRINFRLKNPYNFFLSMLTMAFASVIQKDAAHHAQPFSPEELVTAGPFRYVRYDSEQDCDVLAANEFFIDGRPYLDEIHIYRKISNAYEAYQNGTLDVIFSLPRDTDVPGVTYFDSKRLNAVNINFSHANYLTRHKALRHALAMAIDKNRILNDAYHQRAIPAHSLLTQSSLNTGQRVYHPYNPARAKEIFASYRQQDDLDQPIRILSVVNPKALYLAPAVAIIAENLRTIGMKIELDQLPIEKVSLDEYRKYDIIYGAWISGSDLYLGLEPFINPTGGGNFFGYNNPEIFQALNATLSIRDQAIRQAHFVKIMEQICDDAFMIPVVHVKGAYLARPGVGNLRIQRYYYDDLDWAAVRMDDQPASEPPPADGDAALLAGLIGEQEAFTGEETRAIQQVQENVHHANDKVESIIAAVAEQQGGIEVTHQMIREFIALSERLTAQTVQALRTTSSAIVEAQKGEQVCAQITASLAAIQERMHSILKIVGVFTQDIRQIIEISEQMSQTVQRINTVAIVAAIVAVEGGRWKDDFVTVATAIRDLSTSSRTEVNKIDRIVHDIQGINAEILQTNVSAVAMLDRCIQSVHLNEKSLVALSHVVGDASRCSDVITAGVKQVSAKIASIEEAMGDVNASSALIDSHAQTIIFGSQLQSAILDSLTDNFRDQQTIAADFQAEARDLV